MPRNVIASQIRPGRIINAIQGTHPEVPGRPAFWVEDNGDPLRMPQGGIITYATAHEAAHAAAVRARKNP